MDWVTILGITVSISTVLGVGSAAVRWLVKHYFEEIKHELKPNSGQSIKDQVTRLEQTVNLLEQEHRGLREGHRETHETLRSQDEKITKIYDTLLDFVSKH